MICGVVVWCGLALSAASTVPLVEPAGPTTAVVETKVGEVLRTARHPWLRWPDLADVALAA